MNEQMKDCTNKQISIFSVLCPDWCGKDEENKLCFHSILTAYKVSMTQLKSMWHFEVLPVTSNQLITTRGIGNEIIKVSNLRQRGKKYRHVPVQFSGLGQIM